MVFGCTCAFMNKCIRVWIIIALTMGNFDIINLELNEITELDYFVSA